MIEILQEVWAIRALMASIMVGVMCGILGCFIVLRNMAMIGDALSHAVLPGIVIAFIFVGYSAIGFFVGSVLAGLVTAVAITWIQQRVKTKNDAAIGIVFTAMFAIGVIGISWISKEQGVHLDLKDFLFGNVLGVSDQDLYLTFSVTLIVIFSVIAFYRYLFLSTFQPVIADAMGISTRVIHYFVMLLLSFAVVASLRTVGVILVVAMLITPASTALLLTQRLKQVIFISGLIGFLSAVLGLLAAIHWETTPGPAMTVVATIIYLIAALFSPQRGLILNHFRRRRLHRRIRLEDILKQSIRISPTGDLTMGKLNNRLEMEEPEMRKLLKTLEKEKLLSWKGKDQLQLSATGIEKANRLVRAHRLWETYLVDEVGLTGEQIHAEAEKYEHFLTDDLLDEVDERLGFPQQDPHGSPIPQKKGVSPNALFRLNVGDETIITDDQINARIQADLWKMGLMPGRLLSITRKDDQSMTLLLDGQSFEIPRKLAREINVTAPHSPSDYRLPDDQKVR